MTLFKFVIGNAHPFLLLEPNFTHGPILAGNKLSGSCDYTRDKVSLKEISVKLFGRCLRSRFISFKNFFNHEKLFFPLGFQKSQLTRLEEVAKYGRSAVLGLGKFWRCPSPDCG